MRDRELLLEGVGPADVRRLLAFLGAHAVPGVETWDGRTYARTLDLPAGAGVVTLSPDGSGVRLRLGCADDDAAEAVRRTRHLCGLDDDQRPAERALRKDPHLGPLVRLRPGLLRPGSVDPAETLVRTVVGQQVSLAGASAAAGWLVGAAGRRLSRPAGALTHLFPTAAEIAALDPGTLPMPRARARSVVGLARALADDPRLATDDVALLMLPGVGPWTVDYARFRNRRDPDVLLTGDLAVRRQVEGFGVHGPEAVRAVGQAWSPHRSTAMMHLWAQYLAGPGRRVGPRRRALPAPPP